MNIRDIKDPKALVQSLVKQGLMSFPSPVATANQVKVVLAAKSHDYPSYAQKVAKHRMRRRQKKVETNKAGL